ncbi:unnamed protein product, partial [Ilex paraguariensis]
ASSVDRNKVLTINTHSGGHAVIGFYFAKNLLGSGHEVTIMTVEIVSVGGDPVEIDKVLKGVAFDAVLDNNGKDLDKV